MGGSGCILASYFYEVIGENTYALIKFTTIECSNKSEKTKESEVFEAPLASVLLLFARCVVVFVLRLFAFGVEEPDHAPHLDAKSQTAQKKHERHRPHPAA